VVCNIAGTDESTLAPTPQEKKKRKGKAPELAVLYSHPSE